MDILPQNLLPVGGASAALKQFEKSSNVRVLPAVDDSDALLVALKACPVSVAVISADWPSEAVAAARETILDHAAACVIETEYESGDLEPAIISALADRDRQINNLIANPVVSLMPDAIFYKDRHGRFLAVNDKLAQRFQINDPRLLIGRTDFDFFTADHAQVAFSDEQEIIRTGVSVEARLERETHDEGRTTWCLTWKSPLRDQTGRLIGTCGFSRDVTNFKMTELALSSERHLLEALLTGLPDAVFIKDRERRFLLANHVVASWAGLTVASLLGKRDEEIFSPEVVDAFRSDEESILDTGMPVVNREEKLRTVDGRELVLLTSKLPYRDAEGDVIGIIGIGRNISVRKNFEAQLRAAQEEVVKLRSELELLRGTPRYASC